MDSINYKQLEDYIVYKKYI